MPKFRNGLAKVGRVYHYKFGYKGKDHHGSTGCETRAAAEAVLRQLREDAALRAAGIRPASDSPTLQDLATEWHKAQVLRKGEGTTHARNVVGHVAAWMGELQQLRASEITQAHAQRMIDAYLRTEGNTPGGANAVLRRPAPADWVRSGTRLPDPPTVQDPPTRGAGASEALGSGRAHAEFFHTLKEQGRPAARAAAVLVDDDPGLRESEARHARVEHTDLVNLWHIPYDPEVGTKGGEAQPVPIFPWAALEIAAMVGDRKEGLLVPGRFKERPARRTYTASYVAAAGVAMGIPELTPHCLRGTYATLLSLEGAQVKAIQKAMRHKDPRTTELYIRPVMESVRSAGGRVGEKAGFSETGGTLLACPVKTRRQLLKERSVVQS